MREYTTREVITANIPYAAMVLIGAVTIAFSFGFIPSALVGAVIYFVYGITGAFWIIIFVLIRPKGPQQAGPGQIVAVKCPIIVHPRLG